MKVRQPENVALEVQLTCIDSCMAAPNSVSCQLRTPYNIFAEPLAQVPVIRVFGSTKANQRICLHIHKVWPYLCVKYKGLHSIESVREYGYHLGLSLNHALNISLRSSGIIYVAAVVPIKGIPFYGYHAGYQPFFKILLTNPNVIARASSLLSLGAVMSHKMDVFDSHLSYITQFLVDYNLYGMDWIQARKVLFRSPLPVSEPEKEHQLDGIFSDSSVDGASRWVPQGMPSYLVKPEPPGKATHCELEADLVSEDILNRDLVKERYVHHVFQEGQLDLHFGQLVHSLNTIWADENRRRREHGLEELYPRNSQGQAELERFPTSSSTATLRQPDGNSEKAYKWSNHWRMQSLLQSALIIDKQNLSTRTLSGEAFSETDALNAIADNISQSNMFLDQWPTCLQVDKHSHILFHTGINKTSHFYIDTSLGAISSQASVVLDNKCAGMEASDRRISQHVGPDIVVDVSAIDKVSAQDDYKFADKAQSDAESMSQSDIRQASMTNAQVRNPDAPLKSIYFDSDSADDDYTGFEDMDDGWIENQIREVEQMHTKDRCWSIGQIDGTDDSDDLGFPRRKRRLNQQHQQPMSRDKRRNRRRTLVPLCLKSSSASSGTGATAQFKQKDNSACGSGSGSGDSAILEHKYSSDFGSADVAFNQALSKHSRSRKSVRAAHAEDIGFAGAVDAGLEKYAPSAAGFKLRCARVYAKEDIFVDIDCVLNTAIDNKLHMHKTSSSYPRPKLEPYVEIEVLPFDKAPRHYKNDKHKNKFESACLLGYNSGFFKYSALAPKTRALLSSQAQHNVPESVPPKPHFSDAKDLPQKLKTYSGVSITLPSLSAGSMPVFNPRYLVNSSAAQEFSISELDNSVSVQLTRRQTMWGPQAVITTRSGFDTSSELVANVATNWHRGWWEFAKRPPAPRLLTGDSQVAGKPRNGIRNSRSVITNIIPTPVRQRQRDQSDIKWNSVLGVASAPMTSTEKTKDCKGKSEPVFSRQLSLQSKAINLSQMSLEILADCKPEMLPNPHADCLLFAVASLKRGTGQHGSSRQCQGIQTVVWTWGSETRLSRLGISSSVEKRHFADELSLIDDLARWTCAMDPDILSGYEIQSSSWGYIIQRARYAFNKHLDVELGRVIARSRLRNRDTDDRTVQNRAEWGRRKSSEFRVTGRHLISIWRLMRGELALTSYTLENIVWHVLNERCPYFSPSCLALWFKEGTTVSRIRALRHIIYRARASLRILDKTDIVTRASEMARVIGIDFNSVLTRGSQLRVESLMARIAAPEQFLLLSPTREQVAHQRAAECLPLVLEPQSKYYTDPVVVLDFQSLYPSVMIAFNICFSTCLGSLEEAASKLDNGADDDCLESCDAKAQVNDRRRLGFTNINVPPGMLTALKDKINISPNGVVFVKPSVRKGLLGRMLQELLESRVMIKEAMKRWGGEDIELSKKLDAWQMGLKLISNVTYGYTGASFSGRMPCVDIADAIVQCGRETLESTVQYIHSKYAVWGARVVYGDTDSVFIHMPGKSRESAFRIGKEIAEAVTKRNPAPIKLKFEKVYQPCVLLTKKRYAGWMFSSVEQKEPLLDVKGMELVRRDGCKVTQRILEGAMDALFKTNDLSFVKSFVTAEIGRIFRGDLSVQEFIIAKEVRIGTYSSRNLPAHAKVAADGMLRDMRSEPQYGERVPYVVVSRSRHSRLTDQVVRPQLLLQQPDLRLDYQYYVEKQILPALDRFLSLVGVDVHTWVADMPRRLRTSLFNAVVEVYSDSDGDGDVEASSDQAQEGVQNDL
ncbi:DNA polymerase zeta, partial [Coemansia asiatica]